MSEGGGMVRAAGRGLVGGAFGCLGMLGALVLCVVALVMCSSYSATRRSAGLAAGTASASDYLSFCGVGIGRASGRFFGLAGAAPWIGSDPEVYPGPLPVEVGCPAKAAIGRATVRIRVNCADPLDAACVTVVGAERLDGRPLKPL